MTRPEKGQEASDEEHRAGSSYSKGPHLPGDLDFVLLCMHMLLRL
jgi:hypothetical protein